MKQCKDYTGAACVDGACPIANREEYEDRCYPVIESCEECYFYKGCEDCCFDGTEYCSEEKQKRYRK